MAYDTLLADRIRTYLKAFPALEVREQKMFGGIGFMVNGKMCVNVSGQNLMCRFDPALWEILSQKPGFFPMIMKGKVYKGYCYLAPENIEEKKDLAFWIDLCLDFNSRIKALKKE